MKLVGRFTKNRIRPRKLAPVSKNKELQQLSALFTRISQNAPSNKIIAKISKRLKAPLTNRHPVQLSQLIKEADTTKYQLIVAKVLDADDAVKLPKLNVIALKISEGAKKKIEMYGGKVYKIDQLFDVCSDLDNLQYLQGDVTKRRVYKFFGSPNDKTKKVLPKIITKRKNVLARPS